MKRAIVVFGMGFGDEGKGATVDYLCDKYDIGLVVRYSGGPQSGHNVMHPDGTHCFASFGSGHFAGVPTHLSEYVAVSPGAMWREYLSLKGSAPHCKISADPNCLVITPYHVLADRFRFRRFSGHTCGAGVGEATTYYRKFGQDALFLDDVFNARDKAIRKLELMRHRYIHRIVHEIDHVELPASDRHAWYAYQQDPDELLDDCRDSLAAVPLDLKVRPWSTVENVLFEGSQGVLLDEWQGTTPFCTWATTHPGNALTIVKRHERWCNKAVEVTKVGVIRAVWTRHGAGPFPTKDYTIGASLADPNNPENEYQGKLAFGHFDLPLFKYALQMAGSLDILAINHLDQLAWLDESLGRARWCVDYKDEKLKEWLLPGCQLTQPHGAATAKLHLTTNDLVLEPISAGQLVTHLKHISGASGVITSYGPTRSARMMELDKPLSIERKHATV